jgi:hypothetical protein
MDRSTSETDPKRKNPLHKEAERKAKEQFSELDIYSPHTAKGWREKLLVVISDVTELKRSEEKISFQAYHDSLTGLPNRAQLHDRLLSELAHASRHGTFSALLSTGARYWKLLSYRSVIPHFPAHLSEEANDQTEKTKPILRARNCSLRVRDCRSRELNWILPDVGISRVPIKFNRVVLPDPDGPTNTIFSPVSTLMDT